MDGNLLALYPGSGSGSGLDSELATLLGQWEHRSYRLVALVGWAVVVVVVDAAGVVGRVGACCGIGCFCVGSRVRCGGGIG